MNLSDITTLSITKENLAIIEENPEELVKCIKDAFVGCKNGSENCGVYTYTNKENQEICKIVPSYHTEGEKVFLCGQGIMTDVSKEVIHNKEDIRFQIKRIKQTQTILKRKKVALKEQLKK